MKWTIACFKGKELVAYWNSEFRLLTRTIQIWNNEQELLEQFDKASMYIPMNYYDIVPLIMAISLVEADEYKSIERYEKNAMRHWQHLPERVKTVTDAICLYKS